MSQCMITNCERPVQTRGVCASCYQSLRRKIKAGKTTWNQVMEAGLILPSSSKTSSLEKALQKADLSPSLKQDRQHARVSVGQPLPAIEGMSLYQQDFTNEPLPAVQESTAGPFLAAEVVKVVDDLDSQESIETPQKLHGRILWDNWGPGPQKPLQEPQEKILMASRSPNLESGSERSSERPEDAEEIPAKSYPNKYLPDHSVGNEKLMYGVPPDNDCLDCNGEGCGRCESQVDSTEIDELPEEEETEPSKPSIPMTAQEREKNSQERAEMKARRDAKKSLVPEDLVKNFEPGSPGPLREVGLYVT